MHIREMFYGMLAGNVLISVVFLVQRLLTGMPLFEAFGKFFFAVILTALLTGAAMGLGMLMSELTSRKR